MDRSEDIKDLAAALAKAQAEIEPAEMDRENTYFRSRYATLAAVIRACREPLAKNGLSVVQTTDDGPQDRIRLRTTLFHISGQYVSSVFDVPVVPQETKDGRARAINAQCYGSALTYARRYGWSAMVGVCADDDDDGENATDRGQQQRQAPHQTPQPAAPPQRNGAHQPESSGDRAASQQAPAGNKNACSECGKALTASQVTMSMQKFSRPLCPEHQRTATTEQPTPNAQPATPGAQAPTTNSQPVANPEPKDERREKQKAWHAQLREHCGDLSDDDRHAFTKLLFNKPTVPSEKEWQAAGYEYALRKLNEHAAYCPGIRNGGECSLAARDPFTGDAGSVPQVEGAAA